MKTDVIIIGAGIAGLVCALECLKSGKNVIIIDAQGRDNIGGLARVAFGGMCLIETPEQKSKNIKDSPEIAYQDWCSFAEFEEHDYWPRQWAKYYVENSVSEIYEYIKALNIKFLPAVNWVERGLDVAGNSLPRYHILWGASLRLVQQLAKQLQDYEGKTLIYKFNHKVSQLIKTGHSVVGCRAINHSQQETEFYADNLVVACGGFMGNLERVREAWPVDWEQPQAGLLNGSHPDCDGKLHDAVQAIGGKLTNMQHMWNYAAGIPNPNAKFKNHGLSLIPCRSALWLDHRGKRIGPEPLITGFDTLHCCHRINQLKIPHSWQVLNRRIALKELAISGSEHNTAIRDRKFLRLLKEVLFGNHQLLKKMLSESDCFIIADDLPQLVQKMNLLTPEHSVSLDTLQSSVHNFDTMIKKGKQFWDDEQIQRILSVRKWPTDKLRTCYPKPLQDHSPLIAIKLNLITRKSLGGIKTDMQCRVLDNTEQPVAGLYAIGEAAGFGGGGANGKRSLEGTFLSGCILTARQAARCL